MSAPIELYTPEDVIGYDALWDSAEKCLSGVRWKSSVASFEMNMAERVAKLCNELHDGTYRPRPPVTFTVNSPKRRDIVGIAFRDRVYQRSLNDNVVYPLMSRPWIYDNCACQKGKGTDFARNRLVRHLQWSLRHCSGNLRVLRADVRGYYPNMRHDVAEAEFAKRLPDWALDMACGILRGQYPGDVGYNPGSQIVQIAGVSVLDPLDHVMKESLRAKCYVRYMDDVIVVSDDVGFLLDCMDAMAGWMHERGFEPHPKKTLVQDARKPFPFCGFDYWVDGGKVVTRLSRDSRSRMRRRVGRLARLEGLGKRSEGTARESYESWRAHAEKDGHSLDMDDAWMMNTEERYGCLTPELWLT